MQLQQQMLYDVSLGPSRGFILLNFSTKSINNSDVAVHPSGMFILFPFNVDFNLFKKIESAASVVGRSVADPEAVVDEHR